MQSSKPCHATHLGQLADTPGAVGLADYTSWQRTCVVMATTEIVARQTGIDTQPYTIDAVSRPVKCSNTMLPVVSVAREEGLDQLGFHPRNSKHSLLQRQLSCARVYAVSTLLCFGAISLTLSRQQPPHLYAAKVGVALSADTHVPVPTHIQTLIGQAAISACVTVALLRPLFSLFATTLLRF